MKASFFFPLVIFFSLFFLSCNQENSDPISSGQNLTLQKTGWYYLPNQYWPMHPQNYCTGTEYFSNYSYEFVFQGYNFKLTYEVDSGSCTEFTYYTIKVYVNNTYVTTRQWHNSNPETGWTEWFDFNYDGVAMSYKYELDKHYFGNCTCNIWENRLITVQVRVWGYKYLDPPTTFSGSPDWHNNYSQVVSLSWTPSTDTDVTGYEIDSQRYYIVDGNLAWTNYTKVKTFTTRTASSWQYTPVWGTGSHGGIGYNYRIRAVSTTLGIQSIYRYGAHSYLSDYGYILP